MSVILVTAVGPIPVDRDAVDVDPSARAALLSIGWKEPEERDTE